MTLKTPDLEKVFKKNLFKVICDAVDDQGCIRQFKGPLDAQVVFVEYLMGEDLLTCYDEESADSQVSVEFEAMFGKYFDCLSKLVHHHICVYPRLSVKGQTSPRSCFSKFLTSLLFGSRSSSFSFSNANNNANIANTILSNNDKNKLSFDNLTSGQGGGFFGQAATSSNSSGGLNIQYSSQVNNGLINNQPSSMSKLHQHHNQVQTDNNLKFIGPSQANTSKYSILCNRDNLMCLLLKNGINLISMTKLSSKINNLIGKNRSKIMSVKIFK